MEKPTRNVSIEPSADPAAIFSRHGLGPAGLWGGTAIPTDETTSDTVAAGLCEALEQLGGLYAAFGRFLAWRADLADASYIARLRRLRLNPPVVPLSVVVAIVRRELGIAAHQVAPALKGPPVWNTLARTAWLSSYRNQTIVVEVARHPVGEESFTEFETSMRALKRPELAGIVSVSVLSQFREWIRNGESLVRERSFLEVLSHHQGETLAGYPRLIPELCTSSVLCWPLEEGRPVAELIEQGNSDAPVLVASATLEQFFSLSMVDGDPDLDAMVVDGNNRLHFRRLNNPISVLPGLINNGIKYATAVLAGNAPVSAQTLIRLVNSHPPLDLEKELMDEFSGIEPELKINMWYPSSAAVFEGNWRALARIVPARPLFLDCLHRNLIALGYWNSDAVRAGAPPLDAISEAQWPVVGRLLRTQAGMLMNRESAKEWAFGSGLFMFGAFREMNRLAEEARENDITVGVDVGDWPRPRKHQTRPLYPVVLGALLLFFLAVLQWGGMAPPGFWRWTLKIAAACALPAMFWAVSRIR